MKFWSSPRPVLYPVLPHSSCSSAPLQLTHLAQEQPLSWSLGINLLSMAEVLGLFPKALNEEVLSLPWIAWSWKLQMTRLLPKPIPAEGPARGRRAFPSLSVPSWRWLLSPELRSQLAFPRSHSLGQLTVTPTTICTASVSLLEENETGRGARVMPEAGQLSSPRTWACI